MFAWKIRNARRKARRCAVPPVDARPWRGGAARARPPRIGGHPRAARRLERPGRCRMRGDPRNTRLAAAFAVCRGGCRPVASCAAQCGPPGRWHWGSARRWGPRAAAPTSLGGGYGRVDDGAAPLSTKPRDPADRQRLVEVRDEPARERARCGWIDWVRETAVVSARERR